MFDLDTFIHIVGHVLVADCVEDFPNLWHFWYATSLIVSCSWDFSSRDLIPVYVRYLQPLWRSWSIVYLHLSWRSWSFVYLYHGDSDLSILYVAMTTHVIFYIMPIHGHCTLMYLGLLYVFAIICRDLLLYYTVGWLVLPPISSSLHF